MTDPYGTKVREFHEAFGLKVRDMPDVGSPEERVLRVRLMLEEVLEFAKAAGVGVGVWSAHGLALVPLEQVSQAEIYVQGVPGLTAMAHELADVAYVTHGTAVQLGIPLLPVFAEVHAANMRKLKDGKPIVDGNGKVRKPENWKPADVSAALKRLKEGEG